MSNFIDEPKLGYRYQEALEFAFKKHLYQIRKQGEVPYIAHLLAVSSLVLEAGGTEDEAIAALLHDTVEDVGVSLDEICQLFGFDVAWIVKLVTEDKDLSKPDRKKEYVAAVRETHSDSVRLVSCADKLHNLRSYVTDGKSLWTEDTAKFYDELIPIFEGCSRIPRFWVEEMKELRAKVLLSKVTLQGR